MRLWENSVMQVPCKQPTDYPHDSSWWGGEQCKCNQEPCNQQGKNGCILTFHFCENRATQVLCKQPIGTLKQTEDASQWYDKHYKRNQASNQQRKKEYWILRYLCKDCPGEQAHHEQYGS